MENLPLWTKENEILSRTFEFMDFQGSIDFVNKVAVLSEKNNHHPDIDIRWNKVTLTLTTHDEGKLTDKDFSIAEECDNFLKNL